MKIFSLVQFSICIYQHLSEKDNLDKNLLKIIKMSEAFSDLRENLSRKRNEKKKFDSVQDDRWSHVLFNAKRQVSKSNKEINKTYGHNIKNNMNIKKEETHVRNRIDTTKASIIIQKSLGLIPRPRKFNSEEKTEVHNVELKDKKNTPQEKTIENSIKLKPVKENIQSKLQNRLNRFKVEQTEIAEDKIDFNKKALNLNVESTKTICDKKGNDYIIPQNNDFKSHVSTSLIQPSKLQYQFHKNRSDSNPKLQMYNLRTQSPEIYQEHSNFEQNNFMNFFNSDQMYYYYYYHEQPCYMSMNTIPYQFEQEPSPLIFQSKLQDRLQRIRKSVSDDDVYCKSNSESSSSGSQEHINQINWRKEDYSDKSQDSSLEYQALNDFKGFYVDAPLESLNPQASYLPFSAEMNDYLDQNRYITDINDSEFVSKCFDSKFPNLEEIESLDKEHLEKLALRALHKLSPEQQISLQNIMLTMKPKYFPEMYEYFINYFIELQKVPLDIAAVNFYLRANGITNFP